MQTPNICTSRFPAENVSKLVFVYHLNISKCLSIPLKLLLEKYPRLYSVSCDLIHLAIGAVEASRNNETGSLHCVVAVDNDSGGVLVQR